MTPRYAALAPDARRAYIARAAESVRRRRQIAKARGLCICGDPARVDDYGNRRVACEGCAAFDRARRKAYRVAA